MRMTLIPVLIIAVAVSITACGNLSKQVEKQEKEEKKEPVTMEYIVENSSLKKEDFEGVVFDDFVKEYELTKENWNDYDIEMVLKLYKNSLNDKSIDYTYIFDKAEGKLKEEDIEKLSIIIMHCNSGNQSDCLVLDFENKIAYVDDGYFLDDCSSETEFFDLSDDNVKYIKDEIRNKEVSDWALEYKGTSAGTTGHYIWEIGFETEDGKCMKYTANGVKNNGSPVDVGEWIREIKEYIEGEE